MGGLLRMPQWWHQSELAPSRTQLITTATSLPQEILSLEQRSTQDKHRWARYFIKETAVKSIASACVWGGRELRGSHHTYWPGRHLYEGGLGTRGPSRLTHTQTSYAGTRAFMGHWARLPSTILVARGLLSPMPWFSAAFFCRGSKG